MRRKVAGKSDDITIPSCAIPPAFFLRHVQSLLTCSSGVVHESSHP